MLSLQCARSACRSSSSKSSREAARWTVVAAGAGAGRTTATAGAKRCNATTTANESKDPVLSSLQDGLKQAMRSKDRFRSQVIKSALADIQNFQHQEKPPAPVQTLLSALSKRREALKVYEEQSRQDLVEQFNREISILGEFVPENAREMTAHELTTLIDQVVEELSPADSPNRMSSLSKIIKEVRNRAGLRASSLGKEIADSVKKALSATQ